MTVFMPRPQFISGSYKKETEGNLATGQLDFEKQIH